VGLDEYDADPRLRLEHFIGEPVAILVGYLQLFRDGDLDWENARTPMTQAVLRLNRELLAIAKKETK
jgi:hypothetical protein